MKYAAFVVSAVIFVVLAIYMNEMSKRDATPSGTAYRVFDLYGGQWQDAEKDYADGGFEDGFMCWAAVASNMLTWGGWNEGTGMADVDAVWAYYKTHWPSAAGDPLHAINWWFQGGNDGYPERTAPGGGFFPNLKAEHYFSGPYEGTEGTEHALEHIRKNTIEGYVSAIRVLDEKEHVPHSLTCWGVNVDNKTDKVIGIWVTDSDDDANGAPPRPSRLRYFEVKTRGNKTYVQRYAGGKGANACYIDEVLGLAANPARMKTATASQASQCAIRTRH